MRKLASVMCVALLGGCAMRAPLSRVAIEHNALVANATDEMMLLNIARAMERKPMHFTSISALHGNVTLTAGATLTGTLGAKSIERVTGGSDDTRTVTIPGDGWSPSLTGSVSTNPSFDLAVNDSQEFYQGFLSPVEPSIVAHYLDDGWPSELITYLLVRRFDFVASHTVLQRLEKFRDKKTIRYRHVVLKTDKEENAWQKKNKHDPSADPAVAEKGKVLASLTNDGNPGADGDANVEERFKLLTNFVHCFHLAPASIAEDDHKLGPLARFSNINSVEKLDGKGFDIVADDDGALNLVRKGAGGDSLKLVKVSDEDIKTPRTPTNKGICDVYKDNASATIDEKFISFLRLQNDRKTFINKLTSFKFSSENPDRKDNAGIIVGATGNYGYRPPDDNGEAQVNVPVNVVITLRSPESLIYFLGEYSRFRNQEELKDKVFQTNVGKPIEPSCGKTDHDKSAADVDQETESDNAGQPARPFFVLKKGRAVVRPNLMVKLDGQVYYVPVAAEQCPGRSMQVLALVEQLVNLHKSSKDKIGTQSVRLIQ